MANSIWTPEGYNGEIPQSLSDVPDADNLFYRQSNPESLDNVTGSQDSLLGLEQNTQTPTLNLPEYTPSDAAYAPPAYVPPALEATPNFEAPEYDLGSTGGRVQQLMGPAMRSLESSVQRSLSGDIENPNVRRNVERSALSGYGMGLEDVSAAARGQATSEYDLDYGKQYEAAERGYGTTLADVGMRNQATLEGAGINYGRDLKSYYENIRRDEDVAYTNYVTQNQELIYNFLADLKAWELEAGKTIEIITEGD